MIIAGIDYSMSCPSLCIFDTELDFTFQNCDFYYLIDKKTKIIEEGNIHGEYYSKDSENVKRFDHISDWAITILKNQKVTHVYLEGYSMGSRGRVFHIAENTGVLKQKIYKAGITFEVIPPSTWKKEVVGKGNADKQYVYESMNVDLKPIFKSKSITSPINDIADSYFICKYGSLTSQSQ
tara:strand:+ start:310 stop:849 length:540 start_codon:yes stop_codon:yes gene_type:complete